MQSYVNLRHWGSVRPCGSFSLSPSAAGGKSAPLHSQQPPQREGVHALSLASPVCPFVSLGLRRGPPIARTIDPYMVRASTHHYPFYVWSAVLIINTDSKHTASPLHSSSLLLLSSTHLYYLFLLLLIHHIALHYHYISYFHRSDIGATRFQILALIQTFTLAVARQQI